MSNKIIVRGARVHNLKNITVEIPRGKFVVFTGLSGSGKSSLVFDTIFAEGQRRYVESLSSYARQFLGVLEKPDVDQIEGLPPTIAIDQRSAARNPRSTVGTMTEIYDYLRLLFARVGSVHCFKCGSLLERQTLFKIVNRILTLPEGTEVVILAPVIKEEKGEHRNVFIEAKKAKFTEIRLDGTILPIDEALESKLERNMPHTIDLVIAHLNIDFSDENILDNNALKSYIKKALDVGDGCVILYFPAEDRDLVLSQHFNCSRCNVTITDLSPGNFSFNSPHGACEKCTGLGVSHVIDPELLISNTDLSLDEGAIQPWFKVLNQQKEILHTIKRAFKNVNIPSKEPWKKLTKPQKDFVLYGKKIKQHCIQTEFRGVVPILEELYKKTNSEYVKSELNNYMITVECSACNGERLKKEYLSVTVGGKSISEYVKLDILELQDFLKQLLSPAKETKINNVNRSSSTSVEMLSKEERVIAEPIINEIIVRLSYLIDVGLEYLTLSRSSTTLAGGEAQRIRLASLISSNLVGVAYILDEPSIGLHQRDNKRLIKTLKKMRDQGNSLLVVEHDESTIRAADYIIDIGPGAGEYGGKVVAAGTVDQVKRVKCSLTGQYLSGKLEIPCPKKYRSGTGKYIHIKKASAHNLKNIDVKIPLGKFVCFTGVSGSGKSTLVVDILAKALAHKLYRAKDLAKEHKEIIGVEHINKVINIDQSPIGRTPRSNPATYTNLFNYIRDLFAQIPEAKLKGYSSGHFSFNKDGRCEACNGEGMVKIDMQFLQDIYVDCQECRGTRYNNKILEIYYQGKNIADILSMTVSEAMCFFNQQVVPMIYDKLKLLNDVGLGYMRLGQPATTLSGGEAQRIKLASELSRRSTGKTLYILDEPTTGLHFEDIKKLLAVLNKLVDKKNTVIIIEHNLDVIKSVDWIIDLGPEGGNKGGEIIAQGTPEEVSKVKKSYTGQFLKKVLH